MSRGEFAAFYGSIAFQLTHIAEGQRLHSYAIIPEAIYEDWKRLQDFDNEMVVSYPGKDKKMHEQTVTRFTDHEHSWTVTTVKCPHPSNPHDVSWRLILSIERDNEIMSSSKMSADDYWAYISKLT